MKLRSRPTQRKDASLSSRRELRRHENAELAARTPTPQEHRIEAETTTQRLRRTSLTRKHALRDGGPVAKIGISSSRLPATKQTRSATKAVLQLSRREAEKKEAVKEKPVRVLRKKSSQGENSLEDVLASLHTSSIPDSLPCREKEFEQIKDFISCCIMASVGGCMYISGVPGTGKTATVLCAVEAVRRNKKTSNVVFCKINGMQLSDPQMIFAKIAKVLKHVWPYKSACRAQSFLDESFSNGDPRRPTVVLLLDEIDLLMSRKQRVLYQVFEWSCREEAKLVVLAVANTLDFPERFLCKRVSSRVGLTRLCFEPYNHNEIQKILEQRLANCSLIAKEAVQLISRKVASVSGDARRALEICRLAVEMYAAEIGPESTGQPGAAKLTFSHVQAALNVMSGALKTQFLQNASQHQQLLLRAALFEYNRTGVEEFTVKALLAQYRSACSNDSVPNVSLDEMRRILQSLIGVGIFATPADGAIFNQTIRFNMHPDDIAAVLPRN